MSKDTQYPSNPWGPFAGDPWSPLLDPVIGPAWDRAVEAASSVRFAHERMRESVSRMQGEDAAGR